MRGNDVVTLEYLQADAILYTISVGKKMFLLIFQQHLNMILKCKTNSQTCLLIALNLCILMDFPIHIDTESMGLPIVYF